MKPNPNIIRVRLFFCPLRKAFFLFCHVLRECHSNNGDYDKETFMLNDFPFVFHTVDAARKLHADGGINVLHEVASDAASELLAARINEMPDEDYAQYLRYHLYICEKPELLGMTNHLLFVGEKK